MRVAKLITFFGSLMFFFLLSAMAWGQVVKEVPHAGPHNLSDLFDVNVNPADISWEYVDPADNSWKTVSDASAFTLPDCRLTLRPTFSCNGTAKLFDPATVEVAIQPDDESPDNSDPRLAVYKKDQVLLQDIPQDDILSLGQTVLFDESFENPSSNSGTSVSIGTGDWNITHIDGNPSALFSAAEPVHGPGTGANGTLYALGTHCGYPPNGEERITSPSITLPANEKSLYVAFSAWFQSESIYDVMEVEISNDGGSTWAPLHTFSGQSFSEGGWTPYLSDLTYFSGQTIQLGFRLKTDGSKQYKGWYIDEVKVYEYEPLTLIASTATAGAAPSLTSTTTFAPNIVSGEPVMAPPLGLNDGGVTLEGSVAMAIKNTYQYLLNRNNILKSAGPNPSRIVVLWDVPYSSDSRKLLSRLLKSFAYLAEAEVGVKFLRTNTDYGKTGLMGGRFYRTPPLEYSQDVLGFRGTDWQDLNTDFDNELYALRKDENLDIKNKYAAIRNFVFQQETLPEEEKVMVPDVCTTVILVTDLVEAVMEDPSTELLDAISGAGANLNIVNTGQPGAELPLKDILSYQDHIDQARGLAEASGGQMIQHQGDIDSRSITQVVADQLQNICGPKKYELVKVDFTNNVPIDVNETEAYQAIEYDLNAGRTDPNRKNGLYTATQIYPIAYVKDQKLTANVEVRLLDTQVQPASITLTGSSEEAYGNLSGTLTCASGLCSGTVSSASKVTKTGKWLKKIEWKVDGEVVSEPYTQRIYTLHASPAAPFNTTDQKVTAVMLEYATFAGREQTTDEGVLEQLTAELSSNGWLFTTEKHWVFIKRARSAQFNYSSLENHYTNIFNYSGGARQSFRLDNFTLNIQGKNLAPGIALIETGCADYSLILAMMARSLGISANAYRLSDTEFMQRNLFKPYIPAGKSTTLSEDYIRYHQYVTYGGKAYDASISLVEVGGATKGVLLDDYPSMFLCNYDPSQFTGTVVNDIVPGTADLQRINEVALVDMPSSLMIGTDNFVSIKGTGLVPGDRFEILINDDVTCLSDQHDPGITITAGPVVDGDQIKATISIASTVPEKTYNFSLIRPDYPAAIRSFVKLENTELNSQVYGPGDVADITGCNSVTLTTGFHAQTGSDVRARIVDCGTARYAEEDLSEGEEPIENLLTVFPNPASDLLNVSLDEAEGSLQWQIMGLDGRILKEGNLQPEGGHAAWQIRTTTIPSGLYILQVRTGSGQAYREKIIIQP